MLKILKSHVANRFDRPHRLRRVRAACAAVRVATGRAAVARCQPDNGDGLLLDAAAVAWGHERDGLDLVQGQVRLDVFAAAAVGTAAAAAVGTGVGRLGG